MLWFNLVFAGAMILTYIGPYVDPKKIWFFTLFGMGYPYLLLTNLSFVALWAIFWKRYTWISVLVILLGITHFDRYYGFDLSKALTTETTDVKIMSLNTQDLAGLKVGSTAYQDIIDQFQQHDIILLQEISALQIPNISDYLNDHKLFKPREIHLAILSKYPIINQGLVSKENASNGAIWIEVKVMNQLIRVYNTHLQSYRVKKTTTEIIDNAEFGNEKTWTNVRSVLAAIRDMSIKRSDQIDKIKKHQSETTLPIIIGGDFNDTPVSNTYRRLSRGFTDSFCAKGKGVGTTYAGRIPLLRIDYIFAGAEFEIIDHQVIDSSISDHYPIKSVIRLEPD